MLTILCHIILKVLYKLCHCLFFDTVAFLLDPQQEEYSGVFWDEYIHKIPNTLKSILSLVVSMNIKKITGLCIMALTILILTIPAISVTPTADAQNNTNSNLTGQFGSSQAEVEAQCSLSPACITWNYNLKYQCLMQPL